MSTSAGVSEPASCPRCGAAFQCRADDVEHCHCAAVPLETRLREALARRFDGCLCGDCLRALAASTVEGDPATRRFPAR